MNRAQLVEIVKGLLVAGGPVVILLVNLFGMQSSDAEKIVQAMAAIASVGGIVWMTIGKSDSNMVLDAKAIDGVQVHAQPGVAPKAVLDLAKDPAVPDVVVMSGGPVPDKTT